MPTRTAASDAKAIGENKAASRLRQFDIPVSIPLGRGRGESLGLNVKTIERQTFPPSPFAAKIRSPNVLTLNVSTF
jgi:hypothetical protein